MIKGTIGYSLFGRTLALAGVLFLLGSCASSNVPAPNTSKATSMISQAEEAGAQEYAPVELRNARKKVEQAKALVQQEENKKAMMLVDEASVDAELAMVKARSAKAQEAVKQLRETIETLRKEIQNKQTTEG